MRRDGVEFLNVGFKRTSVYQKLKLLLWNLVLKMSCFINYLLTLCCCCSSVFHCPKKIKYTVGVVRQQLTAPNPSVVVGDASPLVTRETGAESS